jgi:hypothetical protein
MTSKKNYLPFIPSPKLQPEYVCWLDIMGMRSLLRRSVITASIIISRFQKLLAVTKSSKRNFKQIQIYTVMDGAYITCQNKKILQSYLQHIFSKVAYNFISEEDFFYKFVIKGCISYGLIGKGSEIDDDDFSGKDNLVFGLPIIQAYEDEKKAPPFGIFIHQSARALSTIEKEIYSPYTTRWFIWFTKNDDIQEKLKSSLKRYFHKSKKLSHALPYEENEIKKHKDLSIQYLNYYSSCYK